jgi:DNA-binding CsgD family transcriptional regulator
LTDGSPFRASLERSSRTAPALGCSAEETDGGAATLAAALARGLAVDRLRQPLVLLTPDTRVLHVNDAARDLLARTPLVRIADGRLRLPGPAQEDLLDRVHRLVAAGAKELQSGSPGGCLKASAAVQVRDEAVGPATLHLFVTLLAGPGSAASAQPVVLLTLFDPAPAGGVDASLLQELFGLSPAEARVAGLLANGLTLKQIAHEQGTQHETVRKQLRAVYQKTGTHRQAELVRLLLHLPHTAEQV